MPEWLLPLLVPVAAALAGALLAASLLLALRPREAKGEDTGTALLADRMDAMAQRLDAAVAA